MKTGLFPLLFLSATLWLGLARADAGQAPPDGIADNLPPISQFVDKRESPNDKSTNFIAICSRPSPTMIPGHAFFILGDLPPVGPINIVEAAGFGPVEQSWKLYATLPVPGRIEKEMLGKDLPQSSCRLVVRISDKKKAAVQKIVSDWGHSSYQLGRRDCVTMIQTLGKELGLELPERTGPIDIWPRAYVRRMTELNGKAVDPPTIIVP